MTPVVIYMLVDAKLAKGHVVPTAEQLTEQVIMLLSAGNDTTSDALIIGIWQICRLSGACSCLKTN
jgi:cytochrome P450